MIELRYSVLTDPYAADDLWQVDTAPGDENQLILVRLTPGTPVYMKVRAKSARGNSEFSQVVPFQSSSGQTAETAGSAAHSSDNRQGKCCKAVLSFPMGPYRQCTPTVIFCRGRGSTRSIREPARNRGPCHRYVNQQSYLVIQILQHQYCSRPTRVMRPVHSFF